MRLFADIFVFGLGKIALGAGFCPRTSVFPLHYHLKIINLKKNSKIQIIKVFY
jgi:hypothetical protein